MILARYNQYDVAMNKIIDGQTEKSAYIAVVDAGSVPSDYTDLTTSETDAQKIQDWDEFGERAGLSLLNTRLEIVGVEASYTFTTDTTTDAILSKVFAVDKTDRDTIETQAVQEANLVILYTGVFDNNNTAFVAGLALADRDQTASQATDSLENYSDGVVRTIAFDSHSIYGNAASRTVLGSVSESFLAFSGTGAIDDAGWSGIVPIDFKSKMMLGFWWKMDGTGTDQTRIAANIHTSVDEGQTYTVVDEVLELLDNDQDVEAWKAQFMGFKEITISLTGGDYLRIEIERDPGHADDVSNNTFYLNNMVLKYIAKA